MVTRGEVKKLLRETSPSMSASQKSSLKFDPVNEMMSYKHKKNPVRIHRKMIQNSRKDFNQRKMLSDNHQIRNIKQQLDIIIAQKERLLSDDPNDDFSNVIRNYTTTRVVGRINRKRDF